MNRDKKLAAIWRKMHRDYRGVIGGVKYVMLMRNGGTVSAPLASLSDAEIERML